MDPGWTSQSPDAFYMPPTSPAGYPTDLLTLFPFVHGMFPIQESANCRSENQQSACQPPYQSSFYDQQYNQSPSFNNTAESLISTSYENHFGSQSPEPTSTVESPQAAWFLNPATGEVTPSTRESLESDMSKHGHTNVDDDPHGSWQSPLYSNDMSDRSRPDSGNGECGKYLFANPSEIPEDKKAPAERSARLEPMLALAQPPKHRKRPTELAPPGSGRSRTRSSTSSVETSHPTNSAPTRSGRPSLSINSSRPRTSSKSSVSPPPTPTTRPKGRVPHNQVEKKYRENVNSQLEALRRVVPASKQQNGLDDFDIEAVTNSSRMVSKAVVLSSATAHIKQLEKDNSKLMEELAELKAQNRTLQGLVKCDDCSLKQYMKRWKLQA